MLELRALPTDCAQRRQESVCVGCGARAFSVCSSLDPADLAGLDAIAEHEHHLLAYATEQALHIPGLRIIGTAPKKGAILSFTLPGSALGQAPLSPDKAFSLTVTREADGDLAFAWDIAPGHYLYRDHTVASTPGGKASLPLELATGETKDDPGVGGGTRRASPGRDDRFARPRSRGVRQRRHAGRRRGGARAARAGGRLGGCDADQECAGDGGECEQTVHDPLPGRRTVGFSSSQTMPARIAAIPAGPHGRSWVLA